MISLKQVFKHFGSTKAVDGVSLEIPEGQFLGLLGPNGAGKTTTVEMLEGLQFPDSGEISIFGKNWQRDEQELRSLIGLSLQETKFIDKITVLETLDLFGSFCGLSKKRSLEILQLVRLEEKANTYTVQLSGGQRQRLALGLALLNNPRLLLLDEPTTGLDPNARREVWEILKQLRKKLHLTLILTTHYMEEAEQLCERIVIMDQGKILADGSFRQLIQQHAAGELIRIQVSSLLSHDWLVKLPGVQKVKSEAEMEWVLEVESISVTLPILLEQLKQSNVEVIHLDCRRKTLDDLFVQLTGRRLEEENAKGNMP